MTKRFSCIFFLLLFAGIQSGIAQQSLPFQPRSIKGLIVLLPYSAQRVKVLREQGDFATADALAHSYSEMRQRMIADFKDNYSYGTYYFLPDSSAYTLSETRDWSGLLLDPDLKPVQTPMISPADSATVLVAQYGLRARATETAETLQGAEVSYGDDFLAGIYPSFILTDIKLQPFPRKMRRIRGAKFSPQPLRQPKWVYYYRGKRFQVAYNQAASALSARIAQYFGPPPARD